MNMELKPYSIATFYHFAALPDYQAHQKPLLALCRSHDLRGTILLAEEGVNSTIAGTREGLEAALAYLRALPGFAGLSVRFFPSENKPFNRMKVRLKKEAVTMGDPDFEVDMNKGRHLAANAWESLLDDPDTIVLDTRNDYEYQIGTFKGAINPQVESFNQLPQWIEENLSAAKDKKVAIFCTGGVRCEKLGPYMEEKMGFQEVYQLEHGILQYLHETQNKSGYWDGDCFVFDDRVAVNETMDSTAIICDHCHQPMRTENVKYHFCEAGEDCALPQRR